MKAEGGRRKAEVEGERRKAKGERRKAKGRRTCQSSVTSRQSRASARLNAGGADHLPPLLDLGLHEGVAGSGECAARRGPLRQVFQVGQVLESAGGFLVGFEVVKADEMDFYVIENVGLAVPVAFLEVHP